MAVRRRVCTRLNAFVNRIRAESGSRWTPAQLSGLVATVSPALSRSSGRLWQNTAKTVPAVADGDPVRVAVCPFTSVEFTAPTDSARPLLWDEGGGKWSFWMDGIDDVLTAGTSHTWVSQSHGVYARVRTGNLAEYSPVLITNQGVGGWRMVVRVPSGPWGTFRQFVEVPAGSSLMTDVWYTLGMNGGTFRRGGTNDGTYPDSFGRDSVGTLVQVGWDGFRFYSGRNAGSVITSSSLSTANQTLVETYLGGLS